MSFFTLSSGKQAESTSTFELSGGAMEPIPGGSILLAMVTEAKWDEYDGEDLISLRWDVVGKEYTKRVIYQKVRVENSDDKKRDKAIMMLMAIDFNSGGGLAKLSGKPTNDDLNLICNKKMGIKVEVWKMKNKDTGEDMEGNWVSLVSDSKNAGALLKEMGGNPIAKPVVASAPAKADPLSMVDEEDDAPF